MIAAKKLMMVGSAVSDPDARALIARMSPKPSPKRQRAIDSLIVELKSTGVWAVLDGLYVQAAEHAQHALLNWRRPSNDLQADGGTSAFAANFGYDSSTTSLIRGNNFDGSIVNSRGQGGWYSFHNGRPSQQFDLSGFSDDTTSAYIAFQSPATNRDFTFQFGGNRILVPVAAGGMPVENFVTAAFGGNRFSAMFNEAFNENGDTDRGDGRNSRFGINHFLYRDRSAQRDVPRITPNTTVRAFWISRAMTRIQMQQLRTSIGSHLRAIGAIA